ncbi:MAG: hypothetical protein ABIK09_06080 [Pseudomonadota bacterium]
MVVALLLMMPGPALAEGEIPDLRTHETSASSGLQLPPLRKVLGLDAAGFVFRPALTFSTEFNTNLFYADASDPTPPVDAWLIKVIPSLGFQSPTHSVLVVNAKGIFEFRKYFHERETVTKQSMFGGVASMDATFFPRGVVSVTLHEDFRRVIERRNFETTASWDRNFNKAGADINIRPGGRAMSFRVGYNFITDYFLDTTGDWGDVHRHDIHGRYSWKFFPFTALIFEAGWELHDYLDKDQGYYGELTDSKPLRTRIGVNGFITKSLAIMLMAGYGNSFHDTRAVAQGESTNKGENASYSSFLAEARFSWKATPTTIVQIGYKHDFRDSLFSNYLQYDRVYANARQRFFGMWDIRFEASYEYLGYAAIPYAYQTTRPDVIAQYGGLVNQRFRNDSAIRANIGTDIDILRYLNVSLDYQFQMLDTPFFVQLRNTSGPDSLGYMAHVITTMLTVRY